MREARDYGAGQPHLVERDESPKRHVTRADERTGVDTYRGPPRLRAGLPVSVSCLSRPHLWGPDPDPEYGAPEVMLPFVRLRISTGNLGEDA